MREQHRMCHTPIYHIWLGMKKRCFNPNNPKYADYGQRGITVCERWKNSFNAFYQDMGDQPQGCSLDRINNGGDYTPENCRWADAQQQANNRRGNRVVIFRDEAKTLTEWSVIVGVNPSTLANRLTKGWPIEKAFAEPVVKYAPRLITFNGKTQRLPSWAREYDMSVGTLKTRLMLGWDINIALTTPSGGRFNNITFNGETKTLNEWCKALGMARKTIRLRIAYGYPIEKVLDHHWHAPRNTYPDNVTES